MVSRLAGYLEILAYGAARVHSGSFGPTGGRSVKPAQSFSDYIQSFRNNKTMPINRNAIGCHPFQFRFCRILTLQYTKDCAIVLTSRQNQEDE